MLENRGVIRADVGEMPVKAAARHPHRLGQRLGLQRRETAFGQRLEALIEPVFCGKLIGHASSCDNSPYITVLTTASASVTTLHTGLYGDRSDARSSIAMFGFGRDSGGYHSRRAR